MTNSAPTADTDANAKPPVGWRTFACGLSMGAADIVPGVSGGTVALVLGVYTRLLNAIANFDSRFVRLATRGEFSEAANHVDLRFLLTLGAGIATGIVGLASLVHHLLEEHQSLTYAAFFGLILASGVLVGRLCRPRNAATAALCVGLGLSAAALAYWIVTISRVAPIENLGYTFACGAIAICAMILPGVSGAYLLLLLGKYEEVTGILKRLPKLDVTLGDVTTVAVFCLGCGIGLLLFSKLLRWLLTRHHAPTMAVLCGFMIGSLYRVWPLQRDATPDVEEFKRKIFEPVWPTEWTAELTACAAIAAVGFIGVLAVDALATARHAAAPASE